MKKTALLLALVTPLFGATIGQIDTFQDGTTNNWFAGGGPFGQVPTGSPVNVLTGGPGGAGDAYLRLIASGGSGPGSRLVAMNGTQWAGSFAGITGISAHLINLGDSELTIRLYLEDPMGGPPDNEAVSEGVVLPARSAWMQVYFSLAPADLTPLGASDVTALLTNTTLLRIIHSSTADRAEPITGILGIDNIQAVPEPGTASLLLPVLAGLAAAVRHKRR